MIPATAFGCETCGAWPAPKMIDSDELEIFAAYSTDCKLTTASDEP